MSRSGSSLAAVLLVYSCTTPVASLDKDIELEFWAAFKLQNSGNFAAAEAAYRQVLVRAPFMPDAHHLIGVAAHQQGQTARGLKDVVRSLQLRPVFTTAYNNLGNMLFNLGRLELAEEAFSIAIQQNRTNLNAYVGLAENMMALGRYKDAERVSRDAVSESPNFSGGWGALAQALRDMNDIAGAEQAFQRMLELEPSTVSGHSNYGTLLHKQKRYEAAEKELRHAIFLNPMHQNSYYNLGLVLHAQNEKRYPDALRMAAACVRINPDFAQPWYNIGRLFRELGQHNDSMLALHRCQHLSLRDLNVKGADAVLAPRRPPAWGKPKVCKDQIIRTVPAAEWLAEPDVEQIAVHSIQPLRSSGPLAMVYGARWPSSVGGDISGSGFSHRGNEAERLPMASAPEWQSNWYVERGWQVTVHSRRIIEGEFGLIHDGGCRAFLPLHDAYIPFDDQLMPPSLPIVRLEKAITFMQVAARNYYHWVVEALSRLMIAKELLDADPSITVLVDFTPRKSVNPTRNKTNTRVPFAMQYLQLLGFNESRIFPYDGDKHRVAVDKMIYVDWWDRSNRPGMHFCPPQAALLAVRKQFAPEHLPLKQRLNIVLISRADTKHRKLLNEAALEDLLIQLSAKYNKQFQLFVGAGLTIPQTVDIFQQARIVLAPHGAGLANTIFCGDGSAVIELPIQETHGRDMAHLSRAMALDYWMAARSTTPFNFLSDVTADLEEVRRIVETILQRDLQPERSEL